MTINQEKTDQIYRQLEEALYLYFRMIIGGTHSFVNDISLSVIEAHMLRRIHVAGTTTVTELAKQGLVSKGAISLLLSKLDKKGLIEKCPDEKNRSKIRVTTTKLGREIVERHELFHVLHNKQLFSYLSGLNEEEFKVAEEFAHQIKQWIQRFYAGTKMR
jgi:DNA-binding MarR family transcriptional regulator